MKKQEATVPEILKNHYSRGKRFQTRKRHNVNIYFKVRSQKHLDYSDRNNNGPIQ